MSCNFKRFFMLILFPFSQMLVIIPNFQIRDKAGNWVPLLQIIFLCIAEILLFYFLRKSEIKNRQIQELQNIEYKNKLEKLQLDDIKRQEEQLNDLHSHMKAIVQKAINELNPKLVGIPTSNVINIPPYLKIQYCDNLIVNAILKEKELQCKSYHIKIHIEVDLDLKYDISPSHFCSIFSNLLDNAIEASLSLPVNKREISVYAKPKGEYLVILVSNFFSKDYLKRKTAKNRGYGTQILLELADTYNGRYKVSIEDLTYKASVILQAKSK